MPRHLLPSLLAVALLAACGANRQPDDAGASPTSRRTVVKVDNRGLADMTVYVLDGGQRVRLGVAPGNGITELTIPSSLVSGTSRLQFLCDPIGSNRAPVTDQISVEPGDQVTLLIPAS